MKIELQLWLGFVASLRLISVYFGYFDPQKLKDNVFDKFPENEMSDLLARCFAIWTTLSFAITMSLAVKIESKALYVTVVSIFSIF